MLVAARAGSEGTPAAARSLGISLAFREAPMMQRALAAALLTVALVFAPQQVLTNIAYARAASSTASLATFDTAAAAQKHCPRDEVVWLNTNSGIYHEKGMRWYGRTKHGAYVCRKEADAAGDRDTRNGQ